MPLNPNALCTVCIPTYNQARYLAQSVESVIRQTAPVRLLVSNDASPDDTAAVIEQLQEAAAFEAVQHPENLGIGAHTQWLFQQPPTPFIIRLDSDDLLHPNYVQELSALLDHYPEAGYAHCAITLIDATGEALGERRLARVKEYENAESSLRRSVGGYQVSANVLMFRREALAAAGFGTRFGALNHAEDYDLSVRIADAGWGNVYSGKLLAKYRVWADAGRPRAERKLAEVRGLAGVFSGSLPEAFARRGWSAAPLRRRRRELAFNCSDILDQASFAPGERLQMQRALEDLGGSQLVTLVTGEGRLSRILRWGLAATQAGKQAAKHWVKRIVFRRG